MNQPQFSKLEIANSIIIDVILPLADPIFKKRKDNLEMTTEKCTTLII